MAATANFYKMDTMIMWTLGAILAVFSGLATGLGGSVQGIQGCKDVRHAYTAKGFSQNDVPDNAISGNNNKAHWNIHKSRHYDSIQFTVCAL